MVEKNVITKAGLISYKYLAKVISGLDKVIEGLAMNTTAETLSNTQKMIEIMHRKTGLINLKIILEEATAKLDGDALKILVLRYFDGLKIEEICESFSQSKRTIYRKLNSAVNSLSHKIFSSSVYANNVLQIFESENWLKDIYSNLIFQSTLQNKNVRFAEILTDSVDSEHMVQLITNSYRKITVGAIL